MPPSTCPSHWPSSSPRCSTPTPPGGASSDRTTGPCSPEAYLRKNETYESLAAGFGVGTATAWRYVPEAVALLASLAPDLDTAFAGAGDDDAILVDGTVIPTDRVGARGFWSGKHHHPGVNVQAVADLRGRPLSLSPGLGASTHDRRAVQVHGLDEALVRAHRARG